MPRIASLVVAALLLWTASAHAGALEDWREKLVRARALADNDASQAYREAQALEAAQPPGTTAVDQTKLLNVLARAENYLAMTDSAAAHADLALATAKKSGDKVGQVEADLNLALSSVNQGRLDVLVTATTHSMSLIDGIDRPELLSEVMLRTGTMYGRMGEFDASITMPMQALDIAEHGKNPLALAYAHQGMAIALAQTNHAAETQEHYRLMRENARAAHSGILEADATLGIGSTLMNEGKLSEGEAHIRDALTFYRAFKGPFYIGHGLNLLVASLKRQKRTAEAAPLFAEAFDIYEKRRNNTGLWWMLMGRSSERQDAGMLPEAESDAKRAYAIAKSLGTRFYQSRSARRLAAVIAARGDMRRAYAVSVEATELSEMADKDRAGTRLVDLAQHYRTEAKQREIDTLQRSNERQAAEQRSLWILLAASVIISGIVTYFLLRLRRQHRQLEAVNDRLRESRREIEVLNVGLEERVQARTADLRVQARYLRTLIDMLPMWTWFKDTRSRYLVANQAHAAACGRSVDEMVGKSDFDVTPAAVAQSQRNDDVEVMALQERKTAEKYLPDGYASRWMETYKAAVVDEDGTLLGTVGFARDISERKAAEEARNAALAEAERLAQLRSNFLAQMSHELRTPLNGILGYAQILGRDAALDGREAAGLAVIRQSGEQLLTLVNDILDLAKIEAGKLDAAPITVRLHPFLSGIGDIVALRAEQKGLLFSCEMAPTLPDAIRVDERLLRQVLLNLLANAIRFTDEGRVVLRVTREAQNRIRFAVEDTGVGIPPDHLESIFHPFQQTGDKRRRQDGTGLGLAISREFVSRMGGEIRVSSMPGKGSVFQFDLDTPDATAESEPPVRPGVVCGYEGPPKRVLVVDDLADSRAVLADMLQPLGFEIIQAADGHTAVRAAETLKPDVILIDTMMPTMDGCEAIRRLRAIPGFEDKPIIAVSASAATPDRARSLASGATEFLPKPIRLDILLDRIAALLNLRLVRRYADALGDVAGALIPPPLEQMEILHYLALQGNMRDILRHADGLLRLDQGYHPFANRLRQLARGYQSKAILNLVETYLDGSIPG